MSSPTVAVITSTKRYGGLDVTYEALRRQTFKNFIWIIADEHFYDRRYLVQEKVKDVNFTLLEPLPRPEGYYSNLPAIYNRANKIAEGLGCELIISLQDYISIPSNGIERFVGHYNLSADPMLITGLCSMLRRPTAESVYDPRGLWTIFRENYKPERWAHELEWPDVRGSMYHEFGQCSPMSWEMNWACYSVGLTPFDESYGKHLGNENQQFAWGAFLKDGARTYIDPSNHAYSLPHRHYFPEEWAEQQPHRDANAAFHHGLYGEVERLTHSGFTG